MNNHKFGVKNMYNVLINRSIIGISYFAANVMTIILTCIIGIATYGSPTLEQLNKKKIDYEQCITKLNNKISKQPEKKFDSVENDKNRMELGFCLNIRVELYKQINEILMGEVGEKLIRELSLHYLNILKKNNKEIFLNLNINDLIIEIKELKFKWVGALEVSQYNNKNIRTSGACFSDENGFIISSNDFFNTNFNLENLYGIILHEALCSVSEVKEFRTFLFFENNETVRKYNDTHYQISSLLISYAKLLEDKDLEKISLFESLWLKNDVTVFKVNYADGGTLSGGPGGGNMHGLALKIHLINDLFNQQIKCQNYKDQGVVDTTIKWGDNEIPCSLIVSDLLVNAFVNMRVESKELDVKNASSMDSSYSISFAELKNNELFREILIELDFLFSIYGKYKVEVEREKIINTIFKPCFKDRGKSEISYKNNICFLVKWESIK